MLLLFIPFFIILYIDTLIKFTVNLLSMLSIVLTGNATLLTSISIGVLVFTLIITVLQPQIFTVLRKKHLLKKEESLSPARRKKGIVAITLFWKKNKALSTFYKTYQWANLPFTYNFFLTIGFTLFILIFLFSLTIISLAVSVLLASTILYLYFFTVKIIAHNNRQRISEQLPFVLETLASSVQSGHSLVQALKFTTKEIDMPFKLLFDNILTELNYNIPLTQVLENTKKNTDNQELLIALDGLIMQDKLGGDIVQMLNQMANWVRQKNKLQKDIKTFTSQGKLSGLIIMLLWPISAIAFYFLNEAYITILFTSPQGKLFLLLSLLLEILGFAMIWKIIKIKI